MSPRLQATVWTAVGDFVHGIVRPKSMREHWEQAFRPAGILKRTLVIYGGHVLIGWGRQKAAEAQTSGASCRVQPLSVPVLRRED